MGVVVPYLPPTKGNVTLKKKVEGDSASNPTSLSTWHRAFYILEISQHKVNV